MLVGHLLQERLLTRRRPLWVTVLFGSVPIPYGILNVVSEGSPVYHVSYGFVFLLPPVVAYSIAPRVWHNIGRDYAGVAGLSAALVSWLTMFSIALSRFSGPDVSSTTFWVALAIGLLSYGLFSLMATYATARHSALLLPSWALAALMLWIPMGVALRVDREPIPSAAKWSVLSALACQDLRSSCMSPDR